MKMFLKSASRRRRSRVSDEEEGREERENEYCNNYSKKEVTMGGGGCGSVLTVWRKSLLMSCSGFTVIDANGDLAFRVDNYCDKPAEIVLMDASGKSMLTVRRQKTIGRLVESWVVYEGEANDYENTKGSTRKQPVWYVKKQMSLLQSPNSKEIAQVFLKTNNKKVKYVIQGSYCQRSCQVIDMSSNNIVAEIKKKEAINGCASFGLEVFHLIVWPGFDAAFAMTLVLLLDQMFS